MQRLSRYPYIPCIIAYLYFKDGFLCYFYLQHDLQEYSQSFAIFSASEFASDRALKEPKSEYNEQQYDACTAHNRAVRSPKVHPVQINSVFFVFISFHR